MSINLQSKILYGYRKLSVVSRIKKLLNNHKRRKKLPYISIKLAILLKKVKVHKKIYKTHTTDNRKGYSISLNKLQKHNENSKNYQFQKKGSTWDPIKSSFF
jgi:hypothetical protein